MFDVIEKEYENNYIILKGIPASTLLSDISRIYKYHIDMKEPNKKKLFFHIIVSGVIFKKLSIKFHRFFALDIYFVMDKLYDITQRSIYKQTCDLLKEEPNVVKYFTPELELPSSILNKLKDINATLFPFQIQFLTTYYNAINKLGLNGYILSLGMGMGKSLTAQALSYVFDLLPCIITSPRSVAPGWKESILKFMPTIKEDQVKLITEYNPTKDNSKWKYLICNYEKLALAVSYAKYADGDVKLLIIDESQNFRNLKTDRTRSLLKAQQDLNLKNILALSGTPTKALSSELIPILKMLDPLFDDDAVSIFYKVYSRTSYDPISASIIKNKLNIYLEYKDTGDYVKLPAKEYYNILVKLNDPTPYLVSTMKKNVWNYVNEHMPEYQKEVLPNLDKLEDMIKNNSFILENTSKEDREEYINCVRVKYKDPFNKEASGPINHFERELIKPLDSNLFKEILSIRRKVTSYIMILLGKALGIYFTKAKIDLMVAMVKENINAIADIINKGDMKTIIFSTFAAPLFAIEEELNKIGIGAFTHTGQSDVVETKDRFKNDNTIKVLLGTTGSLGTGVDQLQFISNQIIYINRSYRSTDEQQQIARVWRRGQPAKVVKIYYLKLYTNEEPNILDSESEINEWSRAMFNIAIG